MTGLGARVFVGEVEAEVTLQERERVRFRVPPVPGGPKPVRVVAGNQMAQGELGVLGTVDRNRILAFAQGTTVHVSVTAIVAPHPVLNLDSNDPASLTATTDISLIHAMDQYVQSGVGSINLP
ncbi:hypothetical protein [Thermus sp.]|uniref:hypothetical protein n=1 Tax=Thermus sp. TaxID=275 RepID=UPI00391C759C